MSIISENHAEIVDLLTNIIRALRQQSTYNAIAGNVNLGGAVDVEVLGISAALGGIAVLTDMVGATAAAATVSGNMLATWGVGASAAASSAAASMNLSKVLGGGSSAAVSVVEQADMDRQNVLVSSVGSTGALTGVLTVTNKNLAVVVAAAGSVTGYLQGGTPGGDS